MNDEQVVALTGSTPPSQVKSSEDLKKAKRLEHIRDLQWLLNDKRGKRLLLGWLGITDLLGNDAYQPDPNRVYYVLGRRSVGKDLLQDIQIHVPDLYPEVLTDASLA